MYTDYATINGNLSVGAQTCTMNVTISDTVNTVTDAVSGTISGSICGISVSGTL